MAIQTGRRAQDRQLAAAVEIASRAYGRIGVCVLTVIASVWFLSWARGLLIMLSFAVFLTVCLSPAVKLLARLRIPPAIGAAIVLFALCSLIATIADRTGGQLIQVVDEMPSAVHHLRHELDTALNNPGSMAHRLKVLIELPQSGVSPVAQTSAAPPAAAAAVATLQQDTLPFLSLLGEIGAVVFLIYLMLASGEPLQRRIARLHFIPDNTRACMRATIHQTRRSLHQYLGWLVITNTLLGLSVWGAFWLLGVHYAAAWGFAAAVLHFVPYFGPAVIALGSAVFASVQFDSLARGLLVASSTLALSSLIGVVLQTWLSGRSARMNTVAMFVSLLFWSWVWGLPGLVLATPMTIIIKAVCSQLPTLAWFDALLGERAEPLRRRGAAIPSRMPLSTVPLDGAPESSFALSQISRSPD